MMTTGNVSAAAMTFYKKRSQSFLRKKLYIAKLGTMEQIDKNSGQLLSTWRPVPLAPQTNALTEGTAPADINITTNTYSATLLQYGAYVKISDLLEVTGRSSMMDVASKVLGYNAALTLDTVTYAVVLANWTQLFANNTTAATMTAGDVMSATQIRRLRKIFQAKDVMPGEDDLYNLILHPDQYYDLDIDDKVGSFLDVARRSGPTGASDAVWVGEMTRFSGFRVLGSSNIQVTQIANGTTVYQAVAGGPDALLNVDLETMPFSLFVSPATNVNAANPLGQVGTVGWKATYTASDISDGVRGFVVNSAVSEQTF
ncbi:N4-gp56 family major capsid protein [Patescibacteria group bacterium]|nr:N4-gp56 family major capsid protein [Patescibacteria group bacterium]